MNSAAKIGLLTLVAGLAALNALGAQGTVDFDNGGTVNAPNYGPEPGSPTLSKSGSTSYGGSALAGAGYRAQLFYAAGSGQPESALVGSSITTFTTGGFVSALTDTLSTVAPGGAATIQIRVWDNSSGSYSSWSLAQTDWQSGKLAAGKSPLFSVAMTGGGGIPPAPPAVLNGLVSFNIYWTSYNSAGITNQPVSQAVPAGQTATFSVGASGTPPLTYQWRFNGSAIPGAAASSYTVLSVQPSNTGPYTVVVGNLGGSVTSTVATLSLLTTNPWIANASAKWETASNWGLAVPPGYTQWALITNAGTKQVTIDATTSGSFSNSMTVTNLTIGAPSGATNTLSVTNAGTNLPLHVLFQLDLSSNAALSLYNSSLEVDGTLTVGSSGPSFAVATISNATLSAGTLNVGSSAGGLGSLVIQSNAVVNVSSNITIVSSSLSSTSSISISGGSLIASNGLVQIGPTGSGQLLISGGSHTLRQLRLGSTNASGSGFFHMSGGSLKILGHGTGPGAGLDSNFIIVDGGDLDGSGTSITIGDGHDSNAYLAGNGLGQYAAMYVGYSPGVTGTYIQSDTSTMFISTNLIVGDCLGSAVGLVTLNGGTLYVTNAAHTALLDVRNGVFQLNSNATLVVDNLVLTNGCGVFALNGGTLIPFHPPLLPPRTVPLSSGGNFGLSFQTMGNQTYLIQQKTNLAADWVLYTNFVGDGSQLRLVIPITNAPNRFFRVLPQ
ncbi:MAG TPA: immunoglobulin domain-containing protein [Candidatus Binatia bacterium]|jgi:hypothetical protein|nr:immunoglobulin domain-containing protein [Candidatus Binatia bacterium]